MSGGKRALSLILGLTLFAAIIMTSLYFALDFNWFGGRRIPSGTYALSQIRLTLDNERGYAIGIDEFDPN
ncbi:MAG: hypothetical protein FWE01_02420 [Firmicutes bacterium]|nr:hypothetical protein [Bacillota bacterium]